MEGGTIKHVKRLLVLLITSLLISSTLPVGFAYAEEMAQDTPVLKSSAAEASLESSPVKVEPLPTVMAQDIIQAETFYAEQTPHATTPKVLDAPAIPIETESPLLLASPLVISGYKATKNAVDFVQLYNNSDEALLLSDWRIVLIITIEGVESEIAMALPSSFVSPLGYVVIGWNSFIETSDIVATQNISLGQELQDIQLQHTQSSKYAVESTGVIDPAHTNQTLWSWRDGRSTSTKKYSAVTRDFRLITSTDSDNPKKLYGGGIYNYPAIVELRVVEVLAHSRDCSPLENDIACGDYVKLYNLGSEIVDLSGLRLRSGYQGQSSTSSNTTALAGVVTPGGYATVWQREDSQRVSLANTGGFIWLEDKYGIKVYENTAQEYPSAGSDLKKGQSWAYDMLDGLWKWTSPSPLAANVFSVNNAENKGATATELIDCGEGRERNPETNRCRNIPVVSVAACDVGQERNPDTNRCRSVLSSSTSLVQCNENQERNPETNRCRTVALSSTLAVCKEGQERNTETNRCRNIISAANSDKAAFAVTPTASTGGTRTGWLIAGLAAIAAIGYGAYEWRREIGKFVSGIIPGKK